MKIGKKHISWSSLQLPFLSLSLSLNDFEIVLLASRLELEFSCFASLSDNLVFLLICHIICLICIVFACDAKIDMTE